ncbi:MAG: hypothetical protein AB7S38_29425 [Vulcanimicrobiota bacterium]
MRRGNALLTIITLMMVMFVLLNALVALSADRSSQATLYYQEVASLELTEAAVTDVLVQLEADPDWTEGFDQKKIDAKMPGHYTVTFNTSGAGFAAEDSINNLLGDEPADSYLGTDSVPPHTVFLVVTTQVGSQVVQSQVVLGSAGGSLGDYAIAASRNIIMVGDVKVSGIKSLSETDPIKANIHSNRSELSSDIIQWYPKKTGDTVEVDGSLSVTSEHPSAIGLHGPVGSFNVDELIVGAPAKPPPTFDIQSQLMANRGHPRPPLIAGDNVLSPGKYYVPGDIEMLGDLTLDGATLYVEGQLVMGGSLKGDGSVFVGEETIVAGDSVVASNNDQGIALYSRGPVTLTGFALEIYIDELGNSDPQLGVLMDQIQGVLGELESASDMNQVTRLLNAAGNPTGPTPPGLPNDLLGKIAERVQQAPATSTRDSLLTRLDNLKKVYSPVDGNASNPAGTTAQQILDSWRDPDQPDLSGLMGAGLEIYLTTHDAEILELLEHYSLEYQDPWGSARSYFQGIVYSNSWVAIDNQVELLGSVWAFDDGSQLQNGDFDGYTARPGDILLLNNSRLTLNREYADKMSAESGSFLGVRSWTTR